LRTEPARPSLDGETRLISKTEEQKGDAALGCLRKHNLPTGEKLTTKIRKALANIHLGPRIAAKATNERRLRVGASFTPFSVPAG